MSRPERLVGVSLALSILAGLGLTVVYAVGGQPQWEGVLLFLSLGGLGIGLILWGKYVLPPELIVERREVGLSESAEREAAQAALESGGEEVGRRRFLTRLLVGAAGALGLAALFPIRSLGPAPGASLFRTSWRPGSRVVTEEGVAVRASDVPAGTVLTVFPDGSVGSADSQALLIRVEPGSLRLSPEALAGAPGGLVAYSKICTHAGCPVGLYLQTTHELRCPCHQSTFDVLEGARPTYGPAARPLPQLPLEIGTDGYVRAAADFAEPVGPGFWSLP